MNEELSGFIFATVWTLSVLRVLIISWFFPDAYDRITNRWKKFNKFNPIYKQYHDLFISRANLGPWLVRFSLFPFLILGILCMNLSFNLLID
ncbi:MAG: hypothetical protein JEZ00_21970 [Anaerolineaceae bacterium]|nr:hypothetical protein [Anaerolineaceae bacterium]